MRIGSSVALTLLLVASGCDAIRERFGDGSPEAEPATTPEVEGKSPAATSPEAQPAAAKADAPSEPASAAPAIAPAAVASPVAKATTIDATGDHTCAIVASGVACWGGRYARPTDPSVEPHAAPATVVVRGKFVEIATGMAQDCALDDGGTVSCWTVPAKDAPLESITAAPVQGLSKIIALAGDDEQICALQSETDVRCWRAKRKAPGVEEWSIGAPERIAGISDAIDLAVSDGFGCVLGKLGDVACWGKGEVVPKGADAERKAQPIEGLANVVAVATGVRHACALGGDGRVHCWGEGDDGECGDPKDELVSPPRVVEGITGATGIAAGFGFSCAAVSDSVHCWGSDRSGQLGRTQRVGDPAAGPGLLGLVASGGSITDQNDTDEDPTPAPVADLKGSGFEMAAGSTHACARVAGGETRCWGERGSALLGERDLPRGWTELPFTDARTMSVGFNHVCIVNGSGKIECSGGDSWNPGDLGDFAALEGVTTLESGRAFACALDGSRKMSCRTKGTSVVQPFADEIVAMSMDDKLLALTTKNRVVTASANGTNAKELGNWSELGKIRDVVSGGGHYCVVFDDGRVTCFGSNTQGELGLGHARTKPRINTHKLRKLTQVEASSSYTCALAGGEVRCWGAACLAPVKPTKIEGLDDATQIDVNEDRGCARTAGGLVKCWNECDRAEESDNALELPRAERPATARAIQSLEKVAQVGLAGGHACARTEDGKVTCWLLDEQRDLVAGRPPAGLGAVAVTLPP